MADDALKLKINVEMKNGNAAIKTLEKLNEKIASSTKLAKELGEAFAAFGKMTKSLDTLASATKTFSSAFKDVSNTTKTSVTSFDKLSKTLNSLEEKQAKLKIQEERLNQERNKTIISSNKVRSSYEQKVQAMIKTASALHKLDNQMKKNVQTSFTLKIAISNFLALQVDGFVNNIVSSFKNLVIETSKAGIALDGIRNTFAAGARSWKQGGEEMQFVADMANKLGLNLKSTYEPYAKFMTSFTRSGGTIQQSRQIFEDLSTAMVSLHLPAERMEGVFVALEQMANKGTVQAEELKRQLANALPGAFELAAESMGILPAQLMDLMKKGEVVSKDFLPKFAETVKNALGKQVGIAVDQYNAQLNRMQSQTFLLQANLGQMMNNAVVPVIKGITSLLQGLNGLTKGWGESAIAIAFFQTTVIGIGVAMLNAAKNIQIVKTAMALLNTEITRATFASFLKSLNPIAIGLTIVAGAALAVYNKMNLVNKSFDEAAVSQRNVTNEITGLISEFTQLEAIQNKSVAQQEAYNRLFGELQSSYPEVLRYMQEHDISIKNITKSQAEHIANMAIEAKMEEALKTKQEELNNTWVIARTEAKKMGQAFIVVFQSLTAAAVSAVTIIGQAFSKMYSVQMKGLGELTEKAAFVASHVGQKDTAVQLDNLTKKLKGAAKESWNFGKDIHAGAWAAVQRQADKIEQIEVDRVNKAEQRYKDTVVDLGKEQQKIVDSLLQQKAAIQGLSGEENKRKKPSKGTKGYQKTEAEKEWTKEQQRLNALGAKIKTGKATEAEVQEYIVLKTAMDKAKSSLKELTMAEGDIFNLKQQRLSQLENEIKLGIYQGKNVDALVADYNLEKVKMEEVNNAFNSLTGDLQDGWKKEESELKKLRAEYKYMVTHVNEFTDAQIKQVQASLKSKEALAAYAKTMAELEKPMEITKRHAKDLGNNLIDGLLDVVDGSKSFWEAFAEIGKTTLKNYASDMMKRFLDEAVAAFGAGNSNGGIMNGFTNIFKSIFGMGISSDDSQNPMSQGGSSDGGGMSLFSPLIQEAENLSLVLTDTTGTALEGTIEQLSFLTEGANIAGTSFGSMTSPITTVASSIVTMAQAMPTAAMCMGSLSATMQVAAPIFQQAAPAITQMASAMSQLATSSASAATSMAALAVSTAAESVAKIPYVGGFLAPLAAALTGAAIAAGTMMTGAGIAASSAMAGIGQGFGSAASGVGQGIGGFASKLGGGNIIPHAKGGVVSSPTTFPMSGGNIGLAGEAGTEVIAPARRMSNGEVGIGAVQPKVTVNNYTNAAVEVIKRPDNEMEIKIRELNAMLSSSRTNKGFTNAQQRLSTKGKQIG